MWLRQQLQSNATSLKPTHHRRSRTITATQELVVPKSIPITSPTSLPDSHRTDLLLLRDAARNAPFRRLIICNAVIIVSGWKQGGQSAGTKKFGTCQEDSRNSNAVGAGSRGGQQSKFRLLTIFLEAGRATSFFSVFPRGCTCYGKIIQALFGLTFHPHNPDT
jgi:hypothetical protein